jgi:ABC-type oligopeptide transport system substrate-binding subunit
VRHAVLLSLVALVLGASIHAAAAPAELSRKGGTLRISSTADVDSLDPAVAYYDDSWWIEYATCALLYSNPDKSGRAGAIVTPEVAKGFPKVTPDGKTQTIQLRRTYRFHTGQRITAANYVAAFNRDANPRLQSGSVPFLTEVVGANAVIRGKTRTISGVKALGPYTLRIRTKRPLHDLAARLTMPFFCPIAENTPLRKIQSPLGSGPYYVSSHVRNRRLVLERNRFYPGSRPANVDRVDWSIGLGEEACLQSVEQNAIDYCLGHVRGYSRSAEKRLAALYGTNRPNGRFFVNATPQTYYFAFNHDRSAFRGPGQVPLKQAINWALDRAALVAAAGFGQATDQILPPALTRVADLYPRGRLTERNVAKARALLAKAKLKPQKLVLYAPNGGFFPAWAQVLTSNLKRLGIDVVVRYFPFKEVVRRAGIRGEPFDMDISAWSVDYADAITFFGPLLNGNNLRRKGNLNEARFDRPKYNRKIERIDRMRGEQRRRAWANLDVEMMRDDPPWAPVMNGAQRDFVSKSFGCYLFQPIAGHFALGVACKK